MHSCEGTVIKNFKLLFKVCDYLLHPFDYEKFSIHFWCKMAHNQHSDINECSMDENSCTDKCINNIGSYTCDCPSGEVLSSDGVTCVGGLALQVLCSWVYMPL